jgi:hypothetical protein
MTTIKPITIPAPVCVSFDGTATSPVTCNQSRPRGHFWPHRHRFGMLSGRLGLRKRQFAASEGERTVDGPRFREVQSAGGKRIESICEITELEP